MPNPACPCECVLGQISGDSCEMTGGGDGVVSYEPTYTIAMAPAEQKANLPPLLVVTGSDCRSEFTSLCDPDGADCGRALYDNTWSGSECCDGGGSDIIDKDCGDSDTVEVCFGDVCDGAGTGCITMECCPCADDSSSSSDGSSDDSSGSSDSSDGSSGSSGSSDSSDGSSGSSDSSDSSDDSSGSSGSSDSSDDSSGSSGSSDSSDDSSGSSGSSDSSDDSSGSSGSSDSSDDSSGSSDSSDSSDDSSGSSGSSDDSSGSSGSSGSSDSSGTSSVSSSVSSSDSSSDSSDSSSDSSVTSSASSSDSSSTLVSSAVSSIRSGFSTSDIIVLLSYPSTSAFSSSDIDDDEGDDDGDGDGDDGISDNDDDEGDDDSDDDGDGDGDDGISDNDDDEDSSVGSETLVASAPICGNGTLEPPEECDDQNARDNDGCTSTCLLEIGICGDGIVQTLLGEQCEQSTHPSSLSYSCRNCLFLSLSCGDGVIDPGEECDDGALNSTSPSANCRPNCHSGRCGDGILDATEVCDDGNRLNGDGCDRYCLPEKSDTLVATDAFEVSQAALQQYPYPLISPYSQQIGFPQYPNFQQLPYQLPLAQLAPLIQTQGPVGDTGPAAVVVIGAGVAAGWSWMRRKKRK